MNQGALFVSAPIEARACNASCAPLARLPLFQPLLGTDAILAALQHESESQPIFYAAAPETTSAANLLLGLAPAAPAGAMNIHLRLGSLRQPRVLDGALNLAYLSELPATPADTGRHPFADGLTVPHAVAAILTCRDAPPIVTRASGGVVPAYAVATSPVFIAGDPDAYALLPVTPVLSPLWLRHIPSPAVRPPPRPCRRAILIPWNLAHPGSLVPALAARIAALHDEKRWPLAAIILPYNDVPAGLPALAALPPEPLTLARTWSSAATSALAALCHVALLDPTDPEYAATAAALHLPINDFAPPHAEGHVAITTHVYGRQLWRSRILSVRQLAALAVAIAEAPEYTRTSHSPHHDPAAPLMPQIRAAAAAHG